MLTEILFLIMMSVTGFQGEFAHIEVRFTKLEVRPPS